MKHRYLRVLVSLVLTLGLSSCKSDKSDELSGAQTDGFGVKQVDFINKDKSIQSINNTKKLSIDSSIGLDLKVDEAKDFTLKAKTRCYGGTLRSNYYHDQTWQNITSIKVTSLIPIEAFQPLQSENNQIICDFNMEVSNSVGSKTTINLTDIQIINLYGFYDINLMDSDTSKTPFLILENELDRVLEFPFSEGNVHLLCGDELNTLVADNSQISFSLIKEYSFLTKEVNFCRFVFTNPDNKQRRAGRYFYLQKEISKISIDMTPSLPNALRTAAGVSLDFNNQALAYLNIHNYGKTKVYIDFQTMGQSELEILGYYSRGIFFNIAYHSFPLKRVVQWVSSENTIVQKNDKAYIEILPGETSRLMAVTSGRLSCGAGQMAPTAATECTNSTQYHGYLINFSKMPSIKVNHNESLENMNWVSYSTEEKLPLKSYFNDTYHFWKGNPIVYDICKSSTKINENFPSKVTEVFVSNSNLHSCQIN